MKALVAAVALWLVAAPLHAATYDFSFSNVGGNVSGTVTGTFELPDGDGTFEATSMIVTSAPAALGFTTVPLDVGAWRIAANSFTVVGGDVTRAIFGSVLDDPSTPGTQIASFVLAYDFGRFSSGLSNSNLGVTVRDGSGNATTVITATPIPLPASLPLVLAGLAGFAGLRLRKKRQAQA